MKIFVLIAIGQLFLTLARGSEVEKVPKRVVCFYADLKGIRVNILDPEGINATLCTHLVYVKTRIDRDTEVINVEQSYDTNNSSVEGYTDRLLKLKEVNPKLKLLLYIFPQDTTWASTNPSRRSNFIKSAVEVLKLIKFDGLNFVGELYSKYQENIADLLCETQSEFDNHGFTVATMFSELVLPKERNPTIDKIARCCEFITLRTIQFWSESINVTRLLVPLTLISSEVDKYLESGYPANKLVVGIPAFGGIVNLTNINQTGLGSSISGPGMDVLEPYLILYQEIAKKMNDPTEEWTIHRDEATNAPYAYNNKGQWTSYEDTSSVATKAQYILEKNLGGALIVSLDMDDFDGIGGEGKFPLTRTIYDTFNRGLQEDNSTSVA